MGAAAVATCLHCALWSVLADEAVIADAVRVPQLARARVRVHEAGALGIIGARVAGAFVRVDSTIAIKRFGHFT